MAAKHFVLLTPEHVTELFPQDNRSPLRTACLEMIEEQGACVAELTDGEFRVVPVDPTSTALITRELAKVPDLDKRIADLAEMLNNAGTDRNASVENERDACARSVQFLIDSGKGKLSDERLDAFKQAVDTIEGRKNRGVQWIAEMAQGTVLGEFVERMVKDAVAKDRVEREGKLEAVETAWRGFHTRGGARPHIARDRGEGSLAWLQEQLEGIFDQRGSLL